LLHSHKKLSAFDFVAMLIIVSFGILILYL